MTTTIEKNALIEKPVWFITGCSTGFGRQLAECALARGYCVVVTARDPETVKDLEKKGAALILKLDVTDHAQVNAAIKATEDSFGHIDVLVNNAGIGYLAAIEESEDSQVRKMFDVNLFGVSRMIRAVLPGMRKRRKGLIVNISSIAGLCSFPALGYYSATKFAVEAISEALRQEVEPLGIKVMVVEPSGFRTKWAQSAMESPNQIEDYAETAGVVRDRLRANAENELGDPVRAAQAIFAAIESAAPPQHLLLGNHAIDWANEKLESLHKDFSTWEATTRGADSPKETHEQAA